MRVAQVVCSDAEQAASKAQADAKKHNPSPTKRRPGRPKGSKHTPTAGVTLTPAFPRLTGMLDALRHLLAGVLPLPSVLLDGHVGTHNALQRARQSTLPRIATLRCGAVPP